MNLARFLAEALRGALVLGAALIAVRLLGGAPSALRRLTLVAAMGAVLALPLLSPLVTRWQFEAPGFSALVAAPIAEPLSEAGASEVASAERADAPPPAGASPVPLEAWLLCLWISGAVVVAGRWIYGAWRARGLVRRSTPVDPSMWAEEITLRAERDAGASAAIRTSDEVDAPAVTGLFRPVIVLPPDADGWTSARKHLVLVHELSHVARRDCLAQALAELCCALHWFDPLAWVAARRLRLERELAADDAVLASGARASSYAEELLGIALDARVDRSPPSGALGMAGRSELRARVEAILEPSRARRPVSRATGVLLTGGVSAATLAIACASPDTGTTAPQPTAPPAEPAAAAPPVAASSVRASLQAVAAEELDRLVTEWQPVRAVLLALDAASGEVLASAGQERGAAADVAAHVAFVPGSTFKPVTVAAALEEGAIAATQRFDCGRREYGTRALSDANPYGTLDVTEIVAVSSNVGMSRIYDALGSTRMTSWLSTFGFGKAPPLRGAAEPGRLPASLDGWDGAMAALGQGLTASPIQIAAAYGAIASGGVYFEPSDVHRASPEGRRILSARTARTVLDMLEAAVSGERATGKAARISGVRVAGKTGTAEQPGGATYASFVGIVPADAPKYVVLVGAEVKRDDARGGTVAAPVFARAAARMLAR